jgi:hypothetical protein
VVGIEFQHRLRPPFTHNKTKTTMSVSLNVNAYSNKENKEFQKHYNAIKFCIENELSFPIETSEFFKGKINGEDIEDIRRDKMLNYLEDGIEVELKTQIKNDKIYIKVSEIPDHVDIIVVSLD